jgi:hypothetical protein
LQTPNAKIPCSDADLFFTFNDIGKCEYFWCYNFLLLRVACHFPAPCVSLQLSLAHMMANLAGLIYSELAMQFHVYCPVKGKSDRRLQGVNTDIKCVQINYL